ncbi:hypothetical protein AgCh_017714 [Apium graveolens]
MNGTKLPIREWIGNVPQFPIGIDVAVAEGESDGPLKLRDKFFKETEIPLNPKLDDHPTRGNVKQYMRKILDGNCQISLAKFIGSAPFTPSLKPDSGVRTINVETIWRRLVSKETLKVIKEMVFNLRDFQFGVCDSRGDEAILHAIGQFVETH